MSVFDIKKNSAICVLPWVHEYRDINGKIAPCCVGKELRDDESLKLIREQMLKGIQPRACTKCYVQEQESGFSPRMLETIDWLKKFGVPEHTKDPTLQFIDVRFDPTCNLKCKTCGPQFSTLWQKEKKVSFKVNKENIDYLHSIDKTKLKKVYFAGGEPTYIKGYQIFLEELLVVNPLCEVIVNTNLKKLPEAWKTIIKEFKNLTIMCSCDAIEKLGTYVRYPIGWSEFEENVKFVSEHANFLEFNLVASNLTSHKLYETCSWMTQYSKNINLSIVTSPAHFSERAVPVEQRKVYCDSFRKLLNFPISAKVALNFRTKIKYLIKKYSESAYDKKLHEKLQADILEQDSHRKLRMEEVDGFLSNWIHR